MKETDAGGVPALHVALRNLYGTVPGTGTYGAYGVQNIVLLYAVQYVRRTRVISCPFGRTVPYDAYGVQNIVQYFCTRIRVRASFLVPLTMRPCTYRFL